MKIRKLTPEEKAHIEAGGRVFLIQEAEDGAHCIVLANQAGAKVLAIGGTELCYESRELAHGYASSIAALSEDTPMVEAL